MTEQATDHITINGTQLPLYSQPLSLYLRTCAPMLKFKVYGSYNWRGYVAEWVLQDDGLYLANVFGDQENDVPVTVNSLFPFADGPVPALWCYETLSVPIEEREGFVRDYVYSSRYQREMLITIEAGKVTKTVKQEIPRV
jgi:hypothetical protein